MIIKLNRDGKAVMGDSIVVAMPDIYQGTRLVHELVVRMETYMGEALAVSFSDGNGKRITDNYMMYTRKYSDVDGTKKAEYYLTIPNAVLQDSGKKMASVVVLDIYNASENPDTYRIITSRDIEFTVQKSHSTVDFQPVQLGDSAALETAVQKLTKLIDMPIDVIENGGEIAAEIGADGGLDLYNLKGAAGKDGKDGVNATVQWGVNAPSKISTLKWEKI